MTALYIGRSLLHPNACVAYYSLKTSGDFHFAQKQTRVCSLAPTDHNCMIVLPV